MPSTTFVARGPGPFSALVQAAEIGGLRLEPLPPIRVTDRYYDTDDGALLQRGLVLRVREQAGRRTVGLRALDTAHALPDDLDLSGDALADPSHLADDRLDLPPGALTIAVRQITGGAVLAPLLALRQYRTPRVAHDGDQVAGVLSFDVVVYEVPGARVVSNEVEVDSYGADPLGRLAPVFEAKGLERAERSKFARALLRHTRTLAQPVLLLPDETRQLERAAASGDIRLRRRASAVLLDARGERPETIAAQTGMSKARVRHWRQRFREIRLGVLDLDASESGRRSVPPSDAAVPVSVPSFRDLVSPSTRAPFSPPAAERPMTSAPHIPTDQDAPPSRPEPPAAGDGMPSPDDPAGVTDLADLLDLFAPVYPDTPHLDDPPMDDPSTDDLEDAGDVLVRAAPAREAAARAVQASRSGDEATAALWALDEETSGPLRAGVRFPSPRLNPYPVVLGPVREPREAPSFQALPLAARAEPALAEGVPDPFAEIDLRALRRDSPAAAEVDPPAPRPAFRWSAEPRPSLRGDTPLLEAARLGLRHHLVQVEAQAAAFLDTRAPSDARRLLASVQHLRLFADTFEPALPVQTAGPLVAGLRPLDESVSAGLDAIYRAATSPDRREWVRRGLASLADAASYLASSRYQTWTARAHRLLAYLDRQRGTGLLTADFAPPAADDGVGQPGDAPAPTRLRHILGSAVWTRFEAVRAFEDRLGSPTRQDAAHLAAALRALRFVLGVVEPPAADVAAALDAAERAVSRARHRDAGPDGDPSVVAQVWAEIVAPLFRERLAAVVAAI